MITLALDTSTPFLTLALQWPGGELAAAERIERAHAERLADGVQALFNEAGLAFQAERVVIGCGPGSYTGVRIGASYALALARVWGAPLLGVSTLCSLLPAGAGRYAPALDARKGQVYGALYEVTAQGVTQLLAEAKYPAGEFSDLAGARGAALRLDTVPSGLSLIRAAEHLGQNAPEQHLSYL